MKKTIVKNYQPCKQSDDQKKTRKAILEVFQSRIKKTDKKTGGTDGKSSNVKLKVIQKSNPAKIFKKCEDYGPRSSDSMSDSDASTTKTKKVRTKKRRKRSEYNKHRSKTSKNATSKKPAVYQHMKTAHNVTMKDVMETDQSEQRYSSITFNRLATKLGMFNKGKKSNTIGRGPIKVSESVRKKTKEDLKKILNISDADGDNHDNHQSLVMLINSDKENGEQSQWSDVSHPLSHHSINSHRDPLTPVNKSPQSRVKNTHSVSSLSSISTPHLPPVEDFPQSLPLKTIAKTLLLELRPANWFPETGYLRELEDDLNKLMKQNARDQQNKTPVRNTPGSVKSETVKRSLMRSMLINEVPQQSKSDYQTKDRSNNHPAHAHVIEMDRSNNHPAHVHVIEMEVDSSGHTINMQHSNPVPEIPSQPQPMQVETSGPRDSPDVNTFFDARSLLSHNDALIASRIVSEENRTDHQGLTLSSSAGYPHQLLHHSEGHLQADMLGACFSRDMTDQSSEVYHHYSNMQPKMNEPRPCQPSATLSSREAWQLSVHNQSVVTQLIEHPEYMPRFHGDYYKDQLDRWKDMATDQDSALDLLEMADHTSGRNMALSPDHRGTILRQVTPDTDGSPLYLPGALILPLKPSLATPSPPDKLYPRRLY